MTKHLDKQKQCKLMDVVSSPNLSAETKKLLLEILAEPVENPNRVTSTALHKTLKLHGYDVSSRTIQRHRVETCGCF